jgi:hypothetical protein
VRRLAAVAARLDQGLEDGRAGLGGDEGGEADGEGGHDAKAPGA